MLKILLSAAFVAGLLAESAAGAEMCKPPPKCLKPNEYWDPCPSCSSQNCSAIGQKPEVCAAVCIGSCRCSKGYARDNNGDCVPIDYCSKCTKPNEVYDPCPVDCSPQTCETRNNSYSCPNIPADPCDPKCKPACRCKRGFFRNKIGECISAENCAKCPGPHEYWSCGPACDNKCDSKYGQDNCNIQNVKCNEMCYCEKDYARATNGTCIPKKDCKYECPKNEQYDKCPGTLCVPKKCSEAGYPLNCTTVSDCDPCPGGSGCICKDGYLRDCNGKCIPSGDCPSCGGDKNATLGCGNHCGNTCSDYNKPNQVCPLFCLLNGCDCRKGYVYDSNIEKCVLPCDCTPTCKQNEKYSTCANQVCVPQNCSQYGQPMPVCPKIDSNKCKGGCICMNKYLRNKKGLCVPQDECPEAQPCTTTPPPCSCAK